MTTHIQTQAFKIDKKPSKSDAQNYIEAIYNNTDDSQEREQLASLYKYFQPTLPRKCKNIFNWVAKARSKDKCRHYITQSYCRKGNIYATNGHVMYIYTTSERRFSEYEGYIDEKGNKIEFNATFPDVERVIPERNLKYSFSMDDINIIKDDKGIQYGTFYISGVIAKLNLKYLLDTLNGETQATIYLSGTTPEESDHISEPILFVFDDREAVVMPTKL